VDDARYTRIIQACLLNLQVYKAKFIVLFTQLLLIFSHASVSRNCSVVDSRLSSDT